MATAAKSVNVSTTSSHPDDRFTPTLTSMNDTLQLSPSGEGRVEPYELVELFYGSGSSTQASPNTTPSQQPSPSTHHHHHSPRSNGTSSPEVMQVVEVNTRVPSQRTACYTCDACGRSFKEASHFTKHKRGALCRKLSQRLAKNNKKKNSGRENGTDRRNKNSTVGVHKPYQCNMCGARFCDRVNMELHLERHHSTSQQLWVEIGRPVTGGSSCAECNRSFQDRAEATDHHRQHLSSNMAPSNAPQPAPSLIYYHDPLHQVQAYPHANQPPPNTQPALPQPPPLPLQATHLSVPPPPPAPAPPPPPPTAQIHPNMTILHTPQLAPPPSLIPLTQTPSTQPPSIPTLSNVRVGEEGGEE